MHEFYVSYLERLTDLHAGFSEVLKDSPSEGLEWVPGPDMNSILVLVFGV